jgi:sugar-specific transcriptional regulator TrmB
MLEKYLQDLGLSDKEATLYVTMLGMDNASVLDLSKKTKINRTTIYLVLGSLMKKGLASEVQIDKKVHYQAESPERLETYVERQKIVLEEQSKRVKDLIPQLKSVERESGERPVVKYFEGRDGVLSSMQDFFDTKSGEKEVYMIYPRDLMENLRRCPM